METTQEVIYRAANLAQANLLKNLLEEQGIAAEVTNAMLQQAAGDLPYGGPIEPRVVVGENDALAARQMALDFERTIAERESSEDLGGDSSSIRAFKFGIRSFLYLSGWLIAYGVAHKATQGTWLDGSVGAVFLIAFAAVTMYLQWPSPKASGEQDALDDDTDDDAEAETSAFWPTCPHCARRRHTSCPVCETAGTDFPEGFLPRGPAGNEPAPGDAKKLFVLCPICDEAFAPEFAARCEWCGHRFADGRALPRAIVPDDLEMNERAWIVVAGLALLAIGVLALCLYIAPAR